MSFHTAAFVKGNVATTLKTLDPVPDEVLSSSASVVAPKGFYLPRAMRLLAAYAAGNHILRAQIVSPALRRALGRTAVRPTSTPLVFSSGAVTASGLAPSVFFLGRRGPLLAKNELVEVKAASNPPVGAEVAVALLWLCPPEDFDVLPDGERFALRFTYPAPIEDAGGDWSRGLPIAFDEQVSPGEYAVIGLEVVCPSTFAARLIFPGGGPWRPGVVAVESAGGGGDFPGNLCTPSGFSDGTLGVWGRFQSFAPPSLQVWSFPGAPHGGSGYLHVVRSARPRPAAGCGCG